MYNNNFINNDEYNNFYNKYKYIISGLHTVEDYFLILEKLDLPIDKKNILSSLIYAKKPEKSIDYILMKEIIKDLYNYRYREDAYANLPQFLNKTNNLAQIKTFTRIANSKPFKPVYNNIIKEYRNPIQYNVYKQCPHCGHLYSAPKYTDYIICGFGENGYDWEGCGRDWCFKCGKILCKSWENDLLFIEENRNHDINCCKQHSILNNKIYPDDYCQCNNLFVKRNILY